MQKSNIFYNILLYKKNNIDNIIKIVFVVFLIISTFLCNGEFELKQQIVDNRKTTIFITIPATKDNYFYKDYFSFSLDCPGARLSAQKTLEQGTCVYDHSFKDYKVVFIKKTIISCDVEVIEDSCLHPLRLYMTYYRKRDKSIKRHLFTFYLNNKSLSGITPGINTSNKKKPINKTFSAYHLPPKLASQTEAIPHSPYFYLLVSTIFFTLFFFLSISSMFYSKQATIWSLFYLSLKKKYLLFTIMQATSYATGFSLSLFFTQQWLPLCTFVPLVAIFLPTVYFFYFIFSIFSCSFFKTTINNHLTVGAGIKKNILISYLYGIICGSLFFFNFFVKSQSYTSTTMLARAFSLLPVTYFFCIGSFIFFASFYLTYSFFILLFHMPLPEKKQCHFFLSGSILAYLVYSFCSILCILWIFCILFFVLGIFFFSKKCTQTLSSTTIGSITGCFLIASMCLILFKAYRISHSIDHEQRKNTIKYYRE